MSRLSGLIRTRETRRWAVAALTVFALFSVLLLISHVTYDTNDDCTIVSIAAGYLTGEPDAATVFTSYGYGLLLSALYRFIPTLPWHALLLLLLNAMAQTALLAGCLSLCAHGGLKMRYGFLMFGALWLGVLMRYSVQLQFSATAGLLFAAGVLLFALPDTGVGHRARRGRQCVAAGFFLLCFALRPYVALMLAPYAAIPAALDAIGKQPAWRVHARFTLCLLLGYGALYGLDSLLYRAQPGWVAFATFDTQLTSLLDYSANTLSAKGYEAALTAAGWSPSLGQMVRNWFFLDARIEVRSLTALNTALAAQMPALPWLRRLPSLLYATGSLLRRYPMFQGNILGFGLATGVAAVSYLRRRTPLPALRAVLPLGYMLLLIAYFYGVLGRLPLRIAFALACPAYALSLPSLAQSLQAVPQSLAPTRNRLATVALAMLLLLACATVAAGGENGLTLRTQYPAGRPNAALTDAVNAYAAAHPDLVYITDFCQDYAPLRVYPTGATRNLVYWGNGVTHSPAANRQLAGLGYQNLNAERFFDPRVRLLLVGGHSSLETYLTGDYGLTALIAADQTPDFTVYQAVH